MNKEDKKLAKLIDEIYEYTGLIFSDSRAKNFKRLIDKYVKEASEVNNGK